MEYTLNITAERSVVRESLKGILWTIFFHRLFGPITPTMSEFLDVPYPMVENMGELDTLIDEKINQLIKGVFNVPSNDYYLSHGIKTGEVIVQFLDILKASKKKTGWFGQAKLEDEVQKVWESWIINVKCFPVEDVDDTDSSGGGSTSTGTPTKRSNSMDISVQSFEENLNIIIDIADSHKDHIPPITSLESSPFPYSIEVGDKISRGVKYTTVDDDGWGKYIKKMLD